MFKIAVQLLQQRGLDNVLAYDPITSHVHHLFTYLSVVYASFVFVKSNFIIQFVYFFFFFIFVFVFFLCVLSYTFISSMLISAYIYAFVTQLYL